MLVQRGFSAGLVFMSHDNNCVETGVPLQQDWGKACRGRSIKEVARPIHFPIPSHIPHIHLSRQHNVVFKQSPVLYRVNKRICTLGPTLAPDRAPIRSQIPTREPIRASRCNPKMASVLGLGRIPIRKPRLFPDRFPNLSRRHRAIMAEAVRSLTRSMGLAPAQASAPLLRFALIRVLIVALMCPTSKCLAR